MEAPLACLEEFFGSLCMDDVLGKRDVDHLAEKEVFQMAGNSMSVAGLTKVLLPLVRHLQSKSCVGSGIVSGLLVEPYYCTLEP